MSCHFFFFFVNYTATTEIHTYGHPLSLHDALPIVRTAPGCHSPPTVLRFGPSFCIFKDAFMPDATSLSPAFMVVHGNRLDELRSLVISLMRRYPLGPLENEIALVQSNGITQWRSEEHTSELQSLMRISYAVFCLKKKKKQRTQQATHLKI